MKRTLRLFGFVVALVILITTICAISIAAETKTSSITGGIAEESLWPDIIGREEAASEGYVQRLKEAEKNLYTFVFKNKDGTNTLKLFDHPVKYVDVDGTIKDISTNLKQNFDGSYQTAENDIITTFSRKLEDGISLKHKEVDITMIPSMNFNTSSSVVSEKSEDVVSYEYGSSTALEYSLTYMGFKEDIVVRQYTGQTEYHFSLITNGLYVAEKEGCFILADAAGTTQATIGDIIIFTADEKNNAFGSLSSKTIRDGQEYLLTIHIDADYLKDPKTVYPIRIDPTIEVSYGNNGAGAIQDVTINSNAGSSGTSGSLMVGARVDYGISRVLMRFPGLDFDTIGSTDRIQKASVKIRDLMCETESIWINCYVFAGNNWTESTASWSGVSANKFKNRQSGLSVSYANGSKKTPIHTYSFDITEAVRGWRDGTFSQAKGIMFKIPNASEADTTTDNFKTFGSFNRSSYKPSLTVVYNGAIAELVGVKAGTHDHSSALTDIRSYIGDCAYTTIRNRNGTFTASAVRGYLNANATSLFVSRSHGGISTSSGVQVGTFILVNDDDENPERLRSHEITTATDLSNLQLALFIGCKTGVGGVGGKNLPTVAVARGAETAIGFKGEIGCSAANSWTKGFFELMATGETVQGACEALAQRADFAGTYLANPVICGKKSNFLC